MSDLSVLVICPLAILLATAARLVEKANSEGTSLLTFATFLSTNSIVLSILSFS